MTKIIQMLQEEQDYLEQMKIKTKEDIKINNKDKLVGNLRIQKKGNSLQYYHTNVANQKCTQSQDERIKPLKETYIPKTNMELVRNLAQRDYDNKLIQEIEKRQRKLDKVIKEYPSEGLEKIYEMMNEYRKDLVYPIIENDKQYANVWIHAPFVRKVIGDDIPEIYTENGERVRSKSEKMIADKLKQLNIPYRYEAPLRLGRSTVLHPDFTLLNIKKREEIYYEHLGMMDKPEYIESALKRIALYEKNGIFPGDRLLLSWETLEMPLNMKIVEAKLKKFLV